ncbi:hypothetical protein [Synechococcus sp. CCAP 1479/9]|uniref:hypothetical protein n=1 Tax=Synechococcus sp. CCAP 1479/9 TaxID=1221593 RepID=UPI001C22031D|nr:hypothetical protein [Synechococcus sp. CCAP 1479/9]
MLPTLAERLREQHAKTRGRRPARPPWPVPGEPPTALLFQARPELASPAVPAGSPPEPLPRLSAVVITEIATPEPLEPEVSEPQIALPELTEPALAATLPPEPAVSVVPSVPVPPFKVPERTGLAELLLVLVWAVLVVIDGALALASLIDGAAGRQGGPQAGAADTPPSAAPPFLMAASAP